MIGCFCSVVSAAVSSNFLKTAPFYLRAFSPFPSTSRTERQQNIWVNQMSVPRVNSFTK